MGAQHDREARSESEQLRQVALQVADEAATLVRDMRSEAVVSGSVDTKSSETDVVTAADRAAEDLIRRRLHELRPGEPVFGEEHGGDVTADGLRWVVDPIDGTVNYLYGYPWYAVSVAVERNGVAVAGAVVEPVSGRRWSAVHGAGAQVDGVRLAVSSSARLDLSLVCTGFGYDVRQRTAQAKVASELLGRVRDIRRAGAASLDLCAVAAGWVDAYYEHGLHRWDWAAGGLIAAEAGAVLHRPGADPALGRAALLCATPGIAGELRQALLDCGADGI